MTPRLDRHLDLQAATESVDAARGPTVSYANSVTGIWCSRAHAGGREFRAAGQLMPETTDVFTMRYRTDVTVKHRIVFEAVNYDILNVSEGEGRRQWTIVQAKARI